MDISVIIPTFNRGELLMETLKTILAQSHPPKEIIVIDDGGTDVTQSLVARIGHPMLYARIPNSGDLAARNHGVMLSTTPWLAFCDDDDLWRADHLALHVSLHQMVRDLECSFSDFVLVHDGVWDKQQKFDIAPPGYWEADREEVIQSFWVYRKPLFQRLLRFQPIFTSATFMSRSFFDSVAGWETSTSPGTMSDFASALKWASHPPIGAIHLPSVGIRRHGGNVSTNSIDQDLRDIQALLHTLDKNLLAHEYRTEIETSIALRRRQVFDAAFASGQFDLVLEMSPLLPANVHGIKQRLKHVVARLPHPLRETVARALLCVRG
jgi:hypothetical protein